MKKLIFFFLLCMVSLTINAQKAHPDDIDVEPLRELKSQVNDVMKTEKQEAVRTKKIQKIADDFRAVNPRTLQRVDYQPVNDKVKKLTKSDIDTYVSLRKKADAILYKQVQAEPVSRGADRNKDEITKRCMEQAYVYAAIQNDALFRSGWVVIDNVDGIKGLFGNDCDCNEQDRWKAESRDYFGKN